MSFSNILKKMKRVIKQPNKAVEFVIWKMKEIILWDYYYSSLREPKVKSAIPHNNPQIQDEIIKGLRKNGFNILNFKINIIDYKHYMDNSEYNKFPDYYGGVKERNFTEKSLEHYLAAKLLEVSKDDIYRYCECELPHSRNIS